MKPKKKIEQKYRFSYKIPLEPLASVFVDKGYLTVENAKLFADRFQSCYLIDDAPKIDWGKRREVSNDLPSGIGYAGFNRNG